MQFEDVSSTIAAMRQQEDSGYVCRDYLGSNFPNSCDVEDMKHEIALVDYKCREIMVDWFYEIVTLCKFDYETAEIATSYLDRYLTTASGLRALEDRKLFKLAALTCIYIAIKLHEPDVLELIVISNLSSGKFSTEQVEQMEIEILPALQWRLHPPTTLSFTRCFLELLPPNVLHKRSKRFVYELCELQTESAVRDSRFMTVKSSTIAFASMMNSLLIVCSLEENMYKIIGSLLSKLTDIDWNSNEFIEKQKCLYSVVAVEHPEFISLKTRRKQMPPTSCKSTYMYKPLRGGRSHSCHLGNF